MTTPPLPPTSSSVAPTLLEVELIGRVRSHGPLPLAAFMNRALYDPVMGYYARGRNFTAPTAPHGTDFTTAPLLTPLFGTTLAEWVAQQWQRLGSPAAFTLVEAGPGNAFLLRDVLIALQQQHPACFTAAQPHLLEISPALIALQQQTFATFSDTGTEFSGLEPGFSLYNQHPPQWHTSLAQLPQHQPVILLANELLDAFPIALYQYQNDKWQQQVISLTAENSLTFSWRHPRHNHTPALPLTTTGTPWQPATQPEPILLEISPPQTAWLHALKHLLTHTGGAALLIDYGYAALPAIGGTTLQALHHHQPVAPLFQPGETDLTAHVNFSHVQGVLGQPSKGGHCHLSDLTPFLLRHSFARHATTAMATADDTTKQSIEAASHRLLHPNQMGSLFKVLEYLP